MTAPIVVDSWAETRSAFDLFASLPPEPGRFLLESQGGPPAIARWSFLGRRPFLQIQTRGRHIRVWENGDWIDSEGDPLDTLQELMNRFPAAHHPARPPFCGGAVGYLSYDLGRQLERLPDTARDDLQLPELCLSFYDHCLALDHRTQTASLLALPLPGRETQSVSAARSLHSRLSSAPRPPFPPLHRTGAVRLASNFTRATYRPVIERALDYIARGHIYQANIAQRFTVPFTGQPEALFATLRRNNPAPFAAFLDCGDFQIISASPERFLQLDPRTRRVETRPIKGTRPRGATPADDERLRAELLASEKDKAELVMIVDLERNDLGRVCDYGSVHVPDLRRLEPYPTVWHTAATVEGRLRESATLADLLRAAFPGGSITGAPKIRAMQIIEELEGLRRHVYCGSIGYMGFDGGLDLNIAIRTLTLKDGLAYFHAGGGIVADSDPDLEYDETVHKARALARALGAHNIDDLLNS